MIHLRSLLLLLGPLFGLLVPVRPGAAAEASPRVLELRTQKVGDTTYFHVRLETPKGMTVPRLTQDAPGSSARTRLLARLPGLVPQDEKTRAVYHRLEGLVEGRVGPTPPPTPAPTPRGSSPQGAAAPTPAAPVQGLEFVGQLQGKGEAKFLLLYPLDNGGGDRARGGKGRPITWAEMPLKLDFAEAKSVKVPKGARARKPNQAPGSDDLQGLWAAGQASCFAVLEALSPEFGFYSFAREATGRKYGVAAPTLGALPPSQEGNAQLYETTTGAAAIAESMQMQRMRNASFRDMGKRTVDISKVPGIDIAGHPWEKMLAGKKPGDPEPLARLVPEDNYYVRFRNLDRLLEFARLVDLWGGNLLQAVQVSGKDYSLRARYEKQLCLPAVALARSPAARVIKGLAITGSDVYLREGSDVAVIFHLSDRDLFEKSADHFIEQARKEHGTRLREGKETYRGIPVESWVTPLRQVSLYRAAVGEFLINANSLVGLRRVLDTHLGKRRSLAQALDFRYMRTVFRAGDEREDGFAFFSDPFIRNLVGPASKIKLKRRAEALTSLYMETYGAMFTAWETGKLPERQKLLLASSTLRPEELYVPEGKGVAWDPRLRQARSDVYGTIPFATPLIELPIARVTPNEQQEYQNFRAQYLNLWRQYFDPIGIRLSLGEKQVKMETYILPLIESSTYRNLRRFTGNGTATFRPAELAPNTLAQVLVHFAPRWSDVLTEGGVMPGLAPGGSLLGSAVSGLSFLGDWFLVRLDDSPVLGKLGELAIRQEMSPEERSERAEGEVVRLLYQIPLTVGFSVKNSVTLAGLLASVRTSMRVALPGAVDWAPVEPAYKGVEYVRVRPRPNPEVNRLFGNKPDDRDPFLPSFYYGLIDGALYVSLSDAPLKQLIDRSVARREGKETKSEPLVKVNSSLYLAPGAAAQTGKLLRFGLEHQSHQQARANLPVVYALHRCRLLADRASVKDLRVVALRTLGFVPVSPDGAAYRYEPRTDEVVNERHGSLRQPRLHEGIAEGSPLDRLLKELYSVRADLRFREDGVETTLTLGRQAPGK